MAGSGACAASPSSSPVELRSGRQLPARTRNRWGRSGRRARVSERSPTCIPAAGLTRWSWTIDSSIPGRLLNHSEGATDFVLQICKIGGEQGLLRINHNVHRNSRRQIATNRLAQATLHPITVDGAPQHASHGESNPGRVSLRTSQVKNCHVSRKMTLTLLINPLEIGVAEQA